VTIQAALCLSLSLLLVAGEGGARLAASAAEAPAASSQPGLVSIAEALPLPAGRSWFTCPVSKKFLKRYYPENAVQANIQGSATIQCRVGSSGTASECAWVAETPPNYGFGETAEKLGCLMKFRTNTAAPSSSLYLLVPVNFRVPG
jgi:hypothetical protein